MSVQYRSRSCPVAEVPISIIATWQTLKNANRLETFDPGDFKLIIVDEAHHASSTWYVVVYESCS